MSNNIIYKYTTNFLNNTLTNKYLFAKMFGMRYTKKQFEAEYPTEDACLESIFQARFGDMKVCPKCGAYTKFYRVKKRQCYACMHCGHQLHPLAKTIFRKTTTPLKDWFYAVYLVSVSKNGISAKELERHLGVTYKTAWRMLNQIRVVMTEKGLRLSGETEIDETYIGGKDSNHKGRHSSENKKSVVFGMVERDGSAVARHVISSGARALLPQIQEHVEPSTMIYSDEYATYKSLTRLGYSHEVVKHKNMQYRKGNAYTNTIEGFWGQLKRSIDGTYHVVSPKYLQLYLNEFVFRYNFRGVAVGPVLLEMVAQPLSLSA